MTAMSRQGIQGDLYHTGLTQAQSLHNNALPRKGCIAVQLYTHNLVAQGTFRIRVSYQTILLCAGFPKGHRVHRLYIWVG